MGKIKYASEEFVNNLIDSIKSLFNKKVPFSFGIDKNGNYGYIKEGADSVTPFKTLKNVGTITCTYIPATFDLTAYPNLTVNDIHLVPTSFVIRNIEDDSLTSGEITYQTCDINKSLSNGILTVSRTSIQGKSEVALTCDIYIYIKEVLTS